MVSHVLNTDIDKVERWPIAKALAYYDTSVEILKLTRGSGE